MHSVDQSFAVAATASEWRWNPGNGSLRLSKHTGSHGEPWWTGDFIDPRGIVAVYRQADLTRLDFVFAERCHSRSWDRCFGDRTVARLARAMITDFLA